MTSYQFTLFAHIAAGSVALLSFWIAAMLRKGSPLHLRVGRVHMVAMLFVLASGVPLAWMLAQRGQLVGALFLYYLVLLTGTGVRNAWQAVRMKRDRSNFYGPTYWVLIGALASSGIAIIAIGTQVGATLLQVFGGVGVVASIGAVSSWRSAPTDPKWWIREHYGAIIGNGIATHIAFFGIGLRNALPFLDPQVQQMLTWFSPLVVGAIAAVYLNRKYGRRPVTRSAPAVSRPATASAQVSATP